MIKLKVFKTKYWIDYYLILLTPIVDTLNGLILRTNGVSDGLSFGSIYRIIILIYVLYGIARRKNNLIMILLAMYFPLIGLIKGANNGKLVGCLTYGAKWLLPIAIIHYYSFIKRDKDEIQRCIYKTLDFWSAFVPISLILEYIFNLGVASYYDSGFKGYYYSTNDLALVLIVLFIYKLYKSFNNKKSKKNIILAFLNFVAIIILSTKSSMIFAVVSVVYMLIKFGKINCKTVLRVIASGMIMFLLIGFMNDEITKFIMRYQNMWEYSKSSNLVEQFFVFATSGRTSRISGFFNEIYNGNFVINFLFGWIIPDNVNVIEMDFHDLICQYGFIGLIIMIIEYGYLIIMGIRGESPFLYTIIICFIYAMLAGHVISGAFSGTCFSLIFSLLILSVKNNGRY